MAKGELISCVACGHEVAKSAKACPNCGAAPKKPFGKTFNGKLMKWIFILYIFIAVDYALNSRTLPGGFTFGTPATEESATTGEESTDVGVLDDGSTTNETSTEEITPTDSVGDGASGTEGTETTANTTNTNVVTEGTQTETPADNSTEPVVNEDGTIEPVQIGN